MGKDINTILKELIKGKYTTRDLPIIKKEMSPKTEVGWATEYEVVYEENNIQVYKGYYGLGIKFNDKSWLEIFREYYLQLSSTYNGIGSKSTSQLLPFNTLRRTLKHLALAEEMPLDLRKYLAWCLIDHSVELACGHEPEYKELVKAESRLIDLFRYSLLEYFDVPRELWVDKDELIDLSEFGYLVYENEEYKIYSNGILRKLDDEYVPAIYTDSQTLMCSFIILENITDYVWVNRVNYDRCQALAKTITLEYQHKTSRGYYQENAYSPTNSIQELIRTSCEVLDFKDRFPKRINKEVKLIQDNNYLLLDFEDEDEIYFEFPHTFSTKFSPIFMFRNVCSQRSPELFEILMEGLSEAINNMSEESPIRKHVEYYNKWINGEEVNELFTFISSYNQYV